MGGALLVLVVMHKDNTIEIRSVYPHVAYVKVTNSLYWELISAVYTESCRVNCTSVSIIILYIKLKTHTL